MGDTAFWYSSPTLQSECGAGSCHGPPTVHGVVTYLLTRCINSFPFSLVPFLHRGRGLESKGDLSERNSVTDLVQGSKDKDAVCRSEGGRGLRRGFSFSTFRVGSHSSFP